MQPSPILALHVGTGIVGCLSGAVAVSFRKGSRRHAVAGRVFVASMLTLAASGVYLAVMKDQPGTILGGALTFYLVLTAWVTAKRTAGRPGLVDWSALLVVLALLAVAATWGVEAATSRTGMEHGYTAGTYVFLGTVALIAAAGDVRLLVRGEIAGTPRIARHLWRMCFAFFIAAASIFLARQEIFPAVLRRTGVLSVLSFLPLAVMVFWLVRIRITKAYETKRAPVREHLLHHDAELSQQGGHVEVLPL